MGWRLSPIKASRGRRGFTLAEGLMAATLLSMSVVCILGPISASFEQSRAGERAATASALARQLLDEVGGKPFEDPSDYSRILGPEGDEPARSRFDNIDDFHSYTDSSSNLTLLDDSTLSVGDGEVFNRGVTVDYRSDPATSATWGDMALVRITVIQPDGRAIRVNRLACRYPLEP